MRRYLAAAILCAVLIAPASIAFGACSPASAQYVTLPGFPPGVFNNKAALDPAPGGGGSIAHVQDRNAVLPGGGGTSISTTLNGTTAGNFILIMAAWCNSSGCGGSGTISSITTSFSETCTEATSQPNNLNLGSTTDIWFCPNIHGGNDTITVNFAQTSFYGGISVSEFSGVATTTPEDTTAANKNNTVTNPSTWSIATSAAISQSNELVASVVWCVNGCGTAIAGQTGLSTPNVNMGPEYQIGASGTITNSWSNSTTFQTVFASLAAFKHR